MVARDVIAFGAMVTIPGPQENDADDVSLALEVAQSQWTRGDRAEALKWLKKAVDAAFEADDDKRGMELSKVAAEVKAELDKPSTPRIPPPKGAPPLRPSAPPPRKSAPQPPPPQRKSAPKEVPAQLESTGTRRSSAPARRGSKSSIQSKPRVDEDEATREYQLGDGGEETEAAIADEWPTETLDNIDDLVDAPEQTAARAVSKSRSKSGARTVKAKSSKPEPEAKQPSTKPRRQELGMSVPSTRSVRVAVGRDKGAVYVRLLDSQGLRDGEHDAMLVALTSDGDIRGLFR
jgi:hypothetical protein